jgi:predicted acylesterase/phospholipase RssA
MEERESAGTTVGRTKSPQQSAAEPFPWTLEVALSGGGLRASAYALGALLYIVHSGLNVKVKNISSVSGGSITNAFVACECDFSRPVDFSAFLKVVSPLVRKIAFSGLLQRWQSWVWGILVGIVALALLVCLLVLAYTFVGSWLTVRGLLGPPGLVTYSPLVLALAFILLLVLPLLLFLPSWLTDNGGQSWAWGIAVANVALLGALTLLVFAFFESWGAVLVANSPCVLAAALVLLLGLPLILNFRSWPIDRWMETILAADVTFGDLSQRPVDHVFCATDLSYGEPLFFSTAEGGRLFSLLFGRADVPRVPIVKAVRASAAFPPAIPPISIDVATTWVSGWDLQTIKGRARLWLTDGGAFNNFGTEWHEVRRELLFVEYLFFERCKSEDQSKKLLTRHRERYGQVQLVVDASQPVYGKRMGRLGFPIIGFVAYVIRTMNVMYSSTLAGRSRYSETAAAQRMKGYPKKWLARYSTSESFKRLFEEHSAPYDPKHDDDAENQGALRLFVPHALRFDNIRTFWGSVPRDTMDDAELDRITGWPDQNYLAAKRLNYWPWTGDTKLDKVPTTFRKLGKDRTLKLIMEGYLKTREVLFWSLGFEGPPIPDRETFEALLD